MLASGRGLQCMLAMCLNHTHICNSFATGCTIYNHCTPHVCLRSLVKLHKSWRMGPDRAADRANETQRISSPAGKDLAYELDTRLFTAISSDQCHVLYPMFPLIRLISYSRRPRLNGLHGFSLPNEDDCNFIPRVGLLYKDIY